MSNLGAEIEASAVDIVDRWYDSWRSSEHPHVELSEHDIKDSLELQLSVIGKELQKGTRAEPPGLLWKTADRLDPEARVEQRMPIEELVQTYGTLVNVVRNWVNELEIDVAFDDYSYFFQAIIELVAESTRRYTRFAADQVSRERAEYLARLTHQMRTPLTALRARIELIAIKELLNGSQLRCCRNRSAG